jgi:serine/threonine protein kinase
LKVQATVEYIKKRRIGIGQGLNSEVFLVHDPQFDNEIAVKEIPLSTLNQQYFSEAQALYASRHRNIVWIHYAAVTPTHVSLAMPFFFNGSLQSKLAKDPLPLRDLLEIAQGVLTGVGKIHLGGYIHFDLRPSNILFSDDGSPLVADFGQARQVGRGGLITAPRMYVPFFPPEVVTAGVGSILSDIYQVGLLLYCAANGDRIYRSQIRPSPVIEDRIERGLFPNRKIFLPHVPSRLRTIIRKALHVNPAQRFQSASDMADALARVPLPLDWHPKGQKGSDLMWEAARGGQPSLVVKLIQSASGWDVEVYTRAAGNILRRKDLKLWRKGLAFGAADKHLNEIFLHLAK